MMRALALLAGIACAGAAGAAQPIGRLFFTPAERAQLDVQRVQKQQPKPAAKAEAAPEAPPAPQIITYNGIVRRSDGKSILWLNNRPVEEREALSGMGAVTGRVRPDGAVVIENSETGSRINLKVGQRAELQSGRVAEGRPPPEAKSDAKAEGAAKGEAPARSDGAARGEPAKAEAPPKSEPAPRAEAPAAKAPAEAAVPGQYAKDGVPPSAMKSRTP